MEGGGLFPVFPISRYNGNEWLSEVFVVKRAQVSWVVVAGLLASLALGGCTVTEDPEPVSKPGSETASGSEKKPVDAKPLPVPYPGAKANATEEEWVAYMKDDHNATWKPLPNMPGVSVDTASIRSLPKRSNRTGRIKVCKSEDESKCTLNLYLVECTEVGRVTWTHGEDPGVEGMPKPPQTLRSPKLIGSFKYAFCKEE